MKVISWRHILWVISLLSLLVAIGWAYFEPGFEPVLAVLGAVAAFIASFFVENRPKEKAPLSTEVTLYSTECGDKGIDLAEQRLRVSSAFGTYFSGLLETGSSFVPLSAQIDCPVRKGQEGLAPIQRIFWAFQDPMGPRTMIVAAQGGMGKSTLAAKIVRCLYEREAIDMILGDSAKSKHLDPHSGQILEYKPGFMTVSGFLQHVCSQLGVPYENDLQSVTDIRRRLVSRRAIIVVDNLDTVTSGGQLLEVLTKITGRDIRAIVTSRQAINFRASDTQTLLTRLNPLHSRETVGKFLHWHIAQHQSIHPNLARLIADIEDKNRLDWLIEHSGGIPLLLQLLISDVARSSWAHIQRLPTVFGEDLLDYLYESSWHDMDGLGQSGVLAQKILVWLNQQQYSGHRITSKTLQEWAKSRAKDQELIIALNLLHERFLIVNRDLSKGDFAIFPSLSEFLMKHDLGA